MAKKVLIVSTSLVTDSGITDSNDASNHKDTMEASVNPMFVVISVPNWL